MKNIALCILSTEMFILSRDYRSFVCVNIAPCISVAYLKSLFEMKSSVFNLQGTSFLLQIRYIFETLIN